jgi:hypothetical protein
MTTGMTYDVEWRFGVVDKSYNLNFHILENSPAPIILSDSFLFDTDAYDEYDCYLIDEDIKDDDYDTYFFHIGYDFNYDAQGTLIIHWWSLSHANLRKGKVDMTTLAHRTYEEQERRNCVDDELANLRGEEYTAARASEMELRSSFDRDTQALSDQQAANNQGATPLAAIDSSPTATAGSLGSSIAVPPDRPVPPTDRKKWYHFKLKRRKKPGATTQSLLMVSLPTGPSRQIWQSPSNTTALD